jgi:F-type H+-transporting ATPase subunit b
MDETLRQLGGLLLGSVPTIFFVLAVYGIYTVLVHRPLAKVLAERHSRTEGAVEKARAAIAYAEARTADYEQRLREARLAIFRNQEAQRQKALQARAEAVAQARSHAHAEVEAARAGIAQEKEDAQAGLQAEAQNLASEIIKVVLEPALARPRAGGASE